MSLDDSKKATARFNASLSFSHAPPYEELFGERVPLLQVFQLAIANYLRLHSEICKRDLRARLKSMLGGRSVFRGVECGVYAGSSLVACGGLARDAGLRFELLGLDTYEGLPEPSDQDRILAPEGAPYLKRRLFTDTSVDAVSQRLSEAGLAESVFLKAGLFKDTLPTLDERLYHFVNIDCDLYDPHIECLEYFYPRMVKGGVIFFDDYHSVEYPMAGLAVDAFMKDKPERLLHLRFGGDAPNRTKTYFVKY